MKIKSLEWQKDECEVTHHIHSSAGSFPWGYEARMTAYGQVRVRIGTTGWHPFTGTMEEAKAFMPEDYEKRVRACLEGE